MPFDQQGAHGSHEEEEEIVFVLQSTLRSIAILALGGHLSVDFFERQLCCCVQ